MDRNPDDPQSGVVTASLPGVQAGPLARTPAPALEDMLSQLLRAGVLTSLTAICAGTTLTYYHHPEYVSSSSALVELVAPRHLPRSLLDVIEGAAAVRGQAFVMIGLLLLIATPILRVGVSLLLFMQRRERNFTLITATVLMLLLTSFLLGG